MYHKVLYFILFIIFVNLCRPTISDNSGSGEEGAGNPQLEAQFHAKYPGEKVRTKYLELNQEDQERHCRAIWGVGSKPKMRNTMVVVKYDSIKGGKKNNRDLVITVGVIPCEGHKVFREGMQPGTVIKIGKLKTKRYRLWEVMNYELEEDERYDDDGNKWIDPYKYKPETDPNWVNKPPPAYANDENFKRGHSGWFDTPPEEPRRTYWEQYDPEPSPEPSRVVAHDPPGYENSSLVDYGETWERTIFGNRH